MTTFNHMVWHCLCFFSTRFTGHKNFQYKIDSCLNNEDTLIFSGSEDGNVYIWDLVEVFSVLIIDYYYFLLNASQVTYLFSKVGGLEISILLLLLLSLQNKIICMFGYFTGIWLTTSLFFGLALKELFI